MITLAGKPVLTATLALPALGAWTCDAVVSSDTDITGRVALQEGSLVYSGTVKRGGVLSGRWTGRIVGGAGGLEIDAGPRAYQNTTLGVVLDDALAGGGEKRAGDSNPALLALALPQWLRAGTVADALGALIVGLGQSGWRVKRDGTIWVGTDTYPAKKIPHVLINRHDESKHWLIAPESTELGPAVLFEGRRVRQVIHRLSPDGLRTEVHFE